MILLKYICEFFGHWIGVDGKEYIYLGQVHFQIKSGINTSQSNSQSTRFTSRINKIHGSVVWLDSQINTSQSNS
jgi:hypothetical protein